MLAGTACSLIAILTGACGWTLVAEYLGGVTLCSHVQRGHTSPLVSAFAPLAPSQQASHLSDCGPAMHHTMLALLKHALSATGRASCSFEARAVLQQQVSACQALYTHLLFRASTPKPPVWSAGCLSIKGSKPQLKLLPAGSLCSQDGAVPAKAQPGAELDSSQSEAQRSTAGASGGTALQHGSCGVQTLQPPAVQSRDPDLQHTLAACAELPSEQQCEQLRALVTDLNAEKVRVLQSWSPAAPSRRCLLAQSCLWSSRACSS